MKLIIFSILLSAVLWAAPYFSQSLPLLDGVSSGHVIIDKNGTLLRLGLNADQKYRIHIDLDDVSQEAIDALLLYEDRYFYRHPGINPLAILRAAGNFLTGGRRIGGSTITMQVARLRFKLSTGTWSAKIRQIWLALCLERQYSKRQILEAYFNLAPYGANIEGIEAASRIYFHKSASALTLQESLSLAVIPQNPVKRHPLTGKDFTQARQRLEKLWAEQKSEINISADSPLRVFSLAELPFEAPHAAAELIVNRPPGIVQSTISLREQKIIESHLRRFTSRGSIYGLNNAAAILVHAPSAEIRALAGSADFFNKGIFGEVDGTKAKRSPGSTLKPFIYALALDLGLIHPMSLLIDSPRSFSGYDPETFDKAFRGPVSAEEALRASRNLPAIALAQQLKDPDLYTFLQQCEVALAKSREYYGLSLVLGGAEVSMRELAALYVALFNDGLYTTLRLIKETAYKKQTARRVLSREAAFIVLDMLKRQDAEIAKNGQRFAISLKTGTSNGFRDAWTAGIIGDYVLIIWVGNFDNTANPLFVGGETAQPLFMDIASALAAKLPLREKIPTVDLNLARIKVCSATGDLNTELCVNTSETWFIPGVSPVRDSGVYRKILIDKDTGLRACDPDSEKSEYAIREFWPSNLRRIFAQAGIEKQPIPEWLPECRPADPEAAGRPPVITSPKADVIYHARLTTPGQNNISLAAAISPGAKRLFWFADKKLIGATKPDEILIWKPQPGKYMIHCSDDLGRSSSRKVEVRAVK